MSENRDINSGPEGVAVQIGGYPPPHGGVTIHVQELSRRLRKSNIPCWILSNGAAGTETRAEPNVIRFQGRKPLQFAGMLRTLVRLRPDIVHVHIAHGAQALPWVAAYGFVGGRRASLITVHSGLFPSMVRSASSAKRALYRRALDVFTTIIAVTPEIRSGLIALGLSDRKICVIPAYFPTARDRCSMVDERITRLRQRCRLLLFTSGVMHPDYNTAATIELLRELADLDPGLIVVHYGQGSPQYERAAVAAIPDRDRVLFLRELPHHEFIDALNAADMYVRTAAYDGDCIAIREALALGKAVVASNCVTRPAGCTVYDTGTASALAAAVRTAAHARRITAACADVGSERVIDLYRELLRSGVGRRT